MERPPRSGPQLSGTEFEGLFDLSPDLCCIAGFDGYYKRVNAAFARTLRYSTRELQSRPLLDFVHADDVQLVRHVLDVLAGGGDATGHVNRLVCADGSVRWIEWNTRGVPESGVAFGVGRDVTERRRAEAELRDAKRIAEASRDELRRLADEQAALRRVATLVARQASQSEEDVFAAIAEECAQLFGTADIGVVRYEGNGDHVVLASSGAYAEVLPAGSRGPLGDEIPPSRLFPAGRAVRMRTDTLPSGVIGQATRAGGITCVVATPIVVDGRLWGSLGIGTTGNEPFPPGTESRLGDFTELMASAIANTESRAQVERLAKEQAALRRVATLVARESPPDQVFTTVAEEVALLLQPDVAAVVRYEPDGDATVMGGWGGPRVATLVGHRLELDGGGAAGLVYRTGRPARFDDYDADPGPVAARARHIGVRSAIASPIVVGGRLWGSVSVGFRTQTLPADIESRLAEFAELVATAISNLQARSDLAASRARIAAAADEERRRVVRDLHDGAQQRLVQTMLTLKLAQRALRDNDPTVESLLGEAVEQADRSNAELRELAHGILPSALAAGGLRAGVRAVASRVDLPVDIDVTRQRLPAEVEATAYFIVAEALTNVVKYSRATSAEVRASVAGGMVQVEVRDDGIGGADPMGHGLTGLRDRAAALGGSLRVENPAGGGTLVSAALPLSGASR